MKLEAGGVEQNEAENVGKIGGLQPPSQELKDILQQMVFDCQDDKPRTGGLKLPAEFGCIHDWQRHQLPFAAEYGPGYVIVKKCSKCHVLGDPPS